MRGLLFASTFGLLLSFDAAHAREAPSPGKSPRPLVAVLFLEDRTGDLAHASWRLLVNEILSEKLALVKALRVARISAIYAAGLKAGHALGQPIGIEGARRIGELLEAQRIVGGFYEREGSGWRVSVKVFRTAAGTASEEITASGNDWFDICESLAIEVLREIGSSPSVEERELMKGRWTSTTAALQSLADAAFSTVLQEPVSTQEAHVKKALAADPSFARAHWMAAALAAGLNVYGWAPDAPLHVQSRLLDAEALARSAVRLQPSWASARRLLGHVLLMQKRRAEGVMELREARTMDPDDPDTLHSLRMVAGEEEAVRLMEAAAELDRTDPRACNALAQLHFMRKEPEKALDALRDAERLQIGAPNEAHQLFLAYFRLGEPVRALRYYQQIQAGLSKAGLGPEDIRPLQPIAERLRAMLEPVAVDAALPRRLGPEEVERALLDGASPSEKTYLVNPLAGGRRMRERAESILVGSSGELARARALLDALAARVAGEETTAPGKTALEALQHWESAERFTGADQAKLYTSLAREAGLQAFYTIVEKDAHGRAVQHVCSAVLAEGKVYLADPAYFWFGAPHRSFQVLDDIQAVAAYLMEKDGKRERALDRCRTATRLWPESHLPWFTLSLACIYARDRKAALDAARMGVERSPEHYMASLTGGLLASLDGDLEKAEALLRTAASAGTMLGVVRYELGAVLAARGKLEASIDELRAGLRVEPQGARAEWASSAIAKIQEYLTQGGSPSLSLEKPAAD